MPHVAIPPTTTGHATGGTPRQPNVVGPTRPGPNRFAASPALRDRTLVNPVFSHSRDRNLSQSRFQGRFADHTIWHHRHRGIVIGWYGPLFWPYIYADLFEYSFWPYAYDDFWPFAYDDLYEGIFGPYAYAYGEDEEPTALPLATTAQGRTNQSRRTGLCNLHVPGWSDWPINRIAAAVHPDETQQALLDELKDVTLKAVTVLQDSMSKRCAEHSSGPHVG